MPPKVSVIIPTYNCAATIAGTIDFILPSTLLVRKTTCVELCMFTDDVAIREQYEFCLRAMYPWLDKRCKDFLAASMRQSCYKLGVDQFRKGNVLQARDLLRRSLSKDFRQWRAKLLYLCALVIPSKT